MADLDDLACRLFVDADVARRRLEALVADTINGSLHHAGLPGSYITGRHFEIDVEENADFDLVRRFEPPYGPYYARYTLDVLALRGQTRAAHVALLRRLLQSLWGLGIPAHPSAGYGEPLPGPDDLPGRRHSRGYGAYKMRA